MIRYIMSFKQFFGLLMLVIIMASFSQCSSTYKLENNSPIVFGETYCKKWVSGVAEGPSGLDIFIETKDNDIQLDSVYFRGKGTKLKSIASNNLLYVGKFVSASTKKKDLIISSDISQEYTNEAPEIPTKIPFELKRNECVVSYRLNGKIKYYKLTNVIEKHSTDIPM